MGCMPMFIRLMMLLQIWYVKVHLQGADENIVKLINIKSLVINSFIAHRHEQGHCVQPNC